jgi:hypothetical protein
MKFLKYLTVTILMGAYTGCADLDIPPMNIFTDDDILTSSAGVQAYMSSLYSRLPIEDFKYSLKEGNYGGFNTWNCITTPNVLTGENAQGDNGSFVNVNDKHYWKEGYIEINHANYLITELPKYEAQLTKAGIDKWIAEAKFVRAYTYFALVKRYGGVPKLDFVQTLSDDLEKLKVPRAGEKEIYDFILQDLDDAIAGLPDKSENNGRANRNIALAFKSRVALFAASIARYGQNQVWEKSGVMLCGIPASEANKYFEISYNAAKAIESVYSLYKKKWSDTDKAATADNYAELFLDASSPETIFATSYSYNDDVHSFDCINLPLHMAPNYANRFNPTLDYVELFDGLPKNEKGQLNTINADGTYKVFDSLEELYKDCEPRLRGTVLLPGQSFRTYHTDIRRGTIKKEISPADPVQKMVAEGMTTGYTANDFYNNNIVWAATWNNQTPYPITDKISINPSGLDGPIGTGSGTVTGYCGRKWLDPNLVAPAIHASTQTWIDIRYAEILLNRAEAALELAQNGKPASADGADYRTDAFNCINAIRERAGAILLASPADLSDAEPVGIEQGTGGYVLAPNRGQQIIRIERRKELAFENKIFWDMHRWRTGHDEINQRMWRKCNPFLFAQSVVIPETGLIPDYIQGKYIFDCRFDERGSRFTWDIKYYYQAIPNEELKANDLLIQNDKY